MMGRTSRLQEEQSTEGQPSGWDRNAFWYPTLDKRGGLLFLFVALFVLHFNELFGLHASDSLIAGWIPVNLGYYLVMGVLHLGFMILLYYNWPRPEGLEATDETERATASMPAED